MSMSQCPVCQAFMPAHRMIVRGGNGWRVLVCSASCGARLEYSDDTVDRVAAQFATWYALPSPPSANPE